MMRHSMRLSSPLRHLPLLFRDNLHDNLYLYNNRMRIEPGHPQIMFILCVEPLA